MILKSLYGEQAHTHCPSSQASYPGHLILVTLVIGRWRTFSGSGAQVGNIDGWRG